MTSESKLRPAPLTLALLVAAGLGLVAVQLLGRSLQEGSAALLALGTDGRRHRGRGQRLCGVSGRVGASAQRPSGLRKGVIFGVLADFSEVGLVWLAVVFAVDGRPGPAWLAGGLALVVLVIWTALVIRDNRMNAQERVVVVVGVALSSAAFGWLFVRLAGNDQPLPPGSRPGQRPSP